MMAMLLMDFMTHDSHICSSKGGNNSQTAAIVSHSNDDGVGSRAAVDTTTIIDDETKILKTRPDAKPLVFKSFQTLNHYYQVA